MNHTIILITRTNSDNINKLLEFLKSAHNLKCSVVRKQVEIVISITLVSGCEISQFQLGVAIGNFIPHNEIVWHQS